jgi:prophage DNA circulation protein
MNWRDKISPASYRGIPFVVSSDKGEFGRKTVRHDFVGTDDAYIEDLGKASREFSVDAQIVGADYMARRDALIAACETEGPGLLVHPWYGRISVILQGRAIISHQSDEGGCCTISMAFIKSLLTPKPEPVIDAFSSTVAASGAALASANTKFSKGFSVSGQIAHVIDAADEKVVSAINFIRSIKRQARKVGDFERKIDRLLADVSTLLFMSADLADSFFEVLSFDFGSGGIADTYRSAATLVDFRELQKLFTFGDSDSIPDGTAPSIVREAANQEEIRKLVQTAAAIVAARITVDLDFTSYNDAIRVRDIVIDKLDSIMEDTDDDELFASIITLKAQVVSGIAARAMNLSRVLSHTPQQTIPSLVLAQSLYGSIEREQDIVDRNKIHDPAFIPGEVEMEVLSA